MRLAALALAAVLVACKRHPAPTVHPPPPPPPPVVVDAGSPVDVAIEASVEEAETESYPPPLASSWNDPDAIEALARDCDVQSPTIVHGMGDGPDPMNCEDGITEQSCNYDPCHEDVDTPCRIGCGTTCSGCNTRCRTSCRECRVACHDPGCIRACAVSCGRCLEGCLDERDHCMTAGCTARYEACTLRAALAFRRSPCLAACRRCTTACERREDQRPCLEACLGRQRGCTTSNYQHCLSDGPSFGEEEIARLRDAGAPNAR